MRDVNPNGAANLLLGQIEKSQQRRNRRVLQIPREFKFFHFYAIFGQKNSQIISNKPTLGVGSPLIKIMQHCVYWTFCFHKTSKKNGFYTHSLRLCQITNKNAQCEWTFRGQGISVQAKDGFDRLWQTMRIEFRLYGRSILPHAIMATENKTERETVGNI